MRWCSARSVIIADKRDAVVLPDKYGEVWAAEAV